MCNIPTCNQVLPSSLLLSRYLLNIYFVPGSWVTSVIKAKHLPQHLSTQIPAIHSNHETVNYLLSLSISHSYSSCKGTRFIQFLQFYSQTQHHFYDVVVIQCLPMAMKNNHIISYSFFLLFIIVSNFKILSAKISLGGQNNLQCKFLCQISAIMEQNFQILPSSPWPPLWFLAVKPLTISCSHFLELGGCSFISFSNNFLHNV